MSPFEQDVIERLTRLEDRIGGLEKSLAGFKTKVVVIATALGAFVSSVISSLYAGK